MTGCTDFWVEGGLDLLERCPDVRPVHPGVELSTSQAVSAGGFRESTFGLQYNCLAHNTLRGAAGASLLNSELLLEEGYL